MGAAVLLGRVSLKWSETESVYHSYRFVYTIQDTKSPKIGSQDPQENFTLPPLFLSVAKELALSNGAHGQRRAITENSLYRSSFMSIHCQNRSVQHYSICLQESSLFWPPEFADARGGPHKCLNISIFPSLCDT
jgi:hypothetical protein